MITSLNACLQRRWPMRRYLRYSIYSQKQHPFWSMGICSHHTNEVSFLGYSTGAPKGGSKGTCGTLYHRQFARMIGTKSLHRNSLSNCLSRLSNAYQRSFEEESIPFSLVNIQLINAFIDAGYVSSWDHIVGSADTDAATQVPFRGNSDGFLRVYLKYYQGRPAIRGILQISKPGKRVYLSKKKLLKISETQSWGNTKTLFVGTSRGIQTHRQILSETMHPTVGTYGTGPKVDTYGAALQRGYQGGEAYCLVW